MERKDMLKVRITRKKYTGKSYNFMQIFSDDLIYIRDKKTEFYGLLNKEEIEVLPCIYYCIGPFEEELAKLSKDGKWGFINKNGNEMIPIYKKVSYFQSGAAIVIDDKGIQHVIDKNNIQIVGNKEIAEELYITGGEELPENITDIKVVAYSSVLTLNDGSEVRIETSTREELEERINKLINNNNNNNNNILTEENNSKNLTRKRIK